MKKRKMISAMLALLMSVTAVSGMSVSGVRAQTNEEKAREIVADTRKSIFQKAKKMIQ